MVPCREGRHEPKERLEPRSRPPPYAVPQPLVVIHAGEAHSLGSFGARFLPRQGPDSLQGLYSRIVRLKVKTAHATLLAICDAGGAPCWLSLRGRELSLGRDGCHTASMPGFAAGGKPVALRNQCRYILSVPETLRFIKRCSPVSAKTVPVGPAGVARA